MQILFKLLTQFLVIDWKFKRRQKFRVSKCLSINAEANNLLFWLNVFVLRQHFLSNKAKRIEERISTLTVKNCLFYALLILYYETYF